MQGQLGPPTLVGQARKPVFEQSDHTFVYYLNIKKTWVTFVLILVTSMLGTKKPWFHLLYFTTMLGDQHLGPITLRSWFQSLSRNMTNNPCPNGPLESQHVKNKASKTNYEHTPHSSNIKVMNFVRHVIQIHRVGSISQNSCLQGLTYHILVPKMGSETLNQSSEFNVNQLHMYRVRFCVMKSLPRHLSFAIST